MKEPLDIQSRLPTLEVTHTLHFYKGDSACLYLWGIENEKIIGRLIFKRNLLFLLKE